MIIRIVQPEDQDEWLRLRMALWPHHSPDELRAEQEQIMDDENQVVFVLASPEGLLAGFLEASLRSVAAGCITTPVGYIEGWFIKPNMRQEGYGAALVQAAEGWAKARGCKEIASSITSSA